MACGARRREYTNDRSLSDAEIDVILRWVDAGAPKGDDTHVPPLPTFSDGWQLGEPDIVLAMNEAYQIEAEGDDEYRCFVLDPQFETDQWIDVVEVLPGNRTTDHHIVLYVDQAGKIAPRLDAEEPGEGYSCFGTAGFPAYMVPGWGPGYTPTETPAGSGYLLKAGAKLVLQMHYHKNGRPEEDLTRVGLRLARNPTSKVLYNGYVLTPFLNIPPGDPNVVVAGRYPVREDITVYSVVAHMHYLGKSMDIWAILPDDSRVDLVKVPRFDFGWQTEYTLAEPLKLPEGTMLHIKPRSIIRRRARTSTRILRGRSDLVWQRRTRWRLACSFTPVTRRTSPKKRTRRRRVVAPRDDRVECRGD